MPYSDLSYYADSRIPGAVRAATYIREHGGLRGVADTLTVAAQWDNINQMWAWIEAHPLPDNEPTTSERYQTRQLLMAALVAAQNKLQGGDQTGAAAAYQSAKTQYQAHARQMAAQETPSAFSQWAAGLGLDLSSTAVKVAVGVGVVLAAVLVAPVVLRKGR